MRLGWIAMYLLYTLSRSIWILWQCMAITARSDSLSVVILLLNHVWILLTQENDLSASVLPINTARIFSSSLMLGKNKLSAWLDRRPVTDTSPSAFNSFSPFLRGNFHFGSRILLAIILFHNYLVSLAPGLFCTKQIHPCL